MKVFETPASRIAGGGVAEASGGVCGAEGRTVALTTGTVATGSMRSGLPECRRVASVGQAEGGERRTEPSGGAVATRSRAILGRLRPGGDGWAIAAVVAIVLLANVPYLFGITDPNPLGPRSQIATNRPGLISGANTLDPTDGYITQALGHLAASDILHGHLPLWNQYEGVGMPLLGEGQSAALFPPTLLLALPNGQFWEDLLLELVAGVGMVLVLRRIGAGRVAAAGGGAAFALNGAFAWLATTSFNPVPFLPLIVLGLEHAHTASLEHRRGGWWLIAVALALSIYAGFPETTYIDGLVAAVWFLWRCGCGGRPHLAPFVRKAAAGLLAGLLLAAPFLVSFAVGLPHEYVGFHNGNASGITMPRFAFPQLFLPYVYGPPLAFSDAGGTLGAIWGYAGGFIPVSVLVLALVSLLTPGRRGLKALLAVTLVLAVAKVYGQPPVFRDVLAILPGGSSVAFYRYTFPAISFGLAVLAAIGIDGLSRAPVDRRRLALLAAALLAVIALLAYEAHRLVIRLNGGSGHSRWAWAQIGWAVGIVALITLAAAVWRGRRTALILSALLVADVGVMFGIHELSAPRSVHLDTRPVAFLERHLGSGRFFTLGPIAPNYGGYWGLASLNDIDLPLPKRWTSYLTARLDHYVNPVFFVGNAGGGRSPTVPTPAQQLLAHLAAYRESGVRYVVTPPGQALPERPGGLHLALRTPVAWIYGVAGTAPYFSTSSPCRVDPSGRRLARLSCPHPVTLVRRELDFPGWSASIDGRDVPIRLAAGGLFERVRVPAGAHTVSFAYAPPGFTFSVIGLCLGALWLLVAHLVPRRPLRPR